MMCPDDIDSERDCLLSMHILSLLLGIKTKLEYALSYLQEKAATQEIWGTCMEANKAEDQHHEVKYQ